MNIRTAIKLAVLIMVLALILAGCTKKQSTENKINLDEQKKKELDLAAFFAAKCGFCHDLDRIEKSGYKGDQWESVLKRMHNYDNGANLTKEDYPVLLEYLKKTYR